MSMTAQNVLAWAAGEIGYTRWDDPEEGSKYGRWYAQKHGAYYGTSGVPFCAMGASWCATDEEKNSVLPGGDFAYVPYGINAAAREGRLVSPMTQAAPGDLVCFDWDDDGIADHVGIVEANYGGWRCGLAEHRRRRVAPHPRLGLGLRSHPTALRRRDHRLRLHRRHGAPGGSRRDR